MKTMVFGYQDSGVFRKHCFLEPPELFPMDQFSKDEASEVFYKRFYVLPGGGEQEVRLGTGG